MLHWFQLHQVAASHLDTVLEKLKDILDNIGQSIVQRLSCYSFLNSFCFILLYFALFVSIEILISEHYE